MKTEKRKIKSTSKNILDCLMDRRQRGELMLLGGRPSQGKTALAVHFATKAIFQKQPTLYFSLEMDRQRLMERFIAAESRVKLKDIHIGRIPNSSCKILLAATKRLTVAPLFVCDHSTLTTHRIRSISRDLKLRLAREGKTLSAVCIDYLQLIKDPGALRNRREEELLILKELKRMAHELEILVIVNTQLKSSKKRGRPTLSHLPGGQRMGRIPNTVLFVHREYAYGPPDPKLESFAELIFAKNAHGTTRAQTVSFDRRSARFGIK